MTKTRGENKSKKKSAFAAMLKEATMPESNLHITKLWLKSGRLHKLLHRSERLKAHPPFFIGPAEYV